MPEFFCRVGLADNGPFSAKQLQELADEGAIKPDTPVRVGGNGKWYPAGAVLERLQVLANRQPPSSPPVQAGATVETKIAPGPEESSTTASMFRPGRIETRRSYTALGFIAVIFRAMAVLALIAAIARCVVLLNSHQNQIAQIGWELWFSIGIAIVAGIFMWGAGEAIKVIVHTEQNTRRAADALDSIREAVEQAAANSDRRK